MFIMRIKKKTFTIQIIIESERGGWGEWSEWTPCSTTCAGGTRNRYRVCDSPPPRYGALFCEVIYCHRTHFAIRKLLR